MATLTDHHATKREIAPGIWQVAPPLRDTSWWYQWRAERQCRRELGHCWHPAGMIDWFCCMCGGETDGMPQQQCAHCTGKPPKLGWWQRRRKQRRCFHHDRRTGTSWIDSQLIDTGMRKMFWCRECGRTWFT